MKPTVCAVAVLSPHRLLSITTLSSTCLLWNGKLLPPAQVHGHCYQFYCYGSRNLPRPSRHGTTRAIHVRALHIHGLDDA